MDIEQYKGEFLEAFARAKRLGYDQGNVSSASFSNKLLVGKTRDSLGTLFQRVLGSMTPEIVAGNCLNISLLLKNLIEDELNLKSYFTLGSFQLCGKSSFEFTEDELKHWIRHGIPDFANIDIHAWLTLESLEIIDATIATTIGVTCNDPEAVGGVILDLPSDLSEGLSFHPVVVGAEILPDIGAAEVFS
jgi:hypothetical protein